MTAPTAPLPRLTEVVHCVTASWGVTAEHGHVGWTLRFGPSGPSVAVRRLADAEADARALVAAVLGVPEAPLRVRIVPDGETVQTVAAVRHAGGARRPRWRLGGRGV